MKKLKFLHLFLAGEICFLLLPSLYSQQKAVETPWTPTPIVIDGKNEDWGEASLTTEKNVAVDYAFRHDGRNLYILFIFNNPKFLSTIEATGMTIYFSPEGKKKKDFGIRFIRKNISGEELIALMEKQGTPLDEERKNELRSKPQARYLFYEADIITKKAETVAPHDREGVDPPAFRSGRSGQTIVYEFRVPLAGKDVYPGGLGIEPGKTLTVGFEWGGMTKEMRQAMMARMAAEGTSARAMDSSFEESIRGGSETEGMDMGGGGMSAARLRSTPKKYSFWVNIKLSANQE